MGARAGSPPPSRSLNTAIDTEEAEIMWKSLGIALLLLFLVSNCFAQTSYKGLTPGRSTRAEAERVLGQPVKNVSETLSEYRPQPLTSKIYVQYRKGSPVIERIEFSCALEKSDCSDFFAQQHSPMTDDDWEGTVGDGLEKQSKYYRQPFYAVLTFANNKWVRLAFYSRELFEAATAAPEFKRNPGR
jgi:hypothetical protein